MRGGCPGVHRRGGETAQSLGAEKIAKLCDKLQDACLLDGEIRHGLGEISLSGHQRGAKVVAGAMETVAHLRRLMVDTAARQKQRTNLTTGTPNTGNLALANFLVRLGTVYLWHFGKPPRISRQKDTGRPQGPFLRFLTAVFNHVSITMTKEAITMAWKRAREICQRAQKNI